MEHALLAPARRKPVGDEASVRRRVEPVEGLLAWVDQDAIAAVRKLGHVQDRLCLTLEDDEPEPPPPAHGRREDPRCDVGARYLLAEALEARPPPKVAHGILVLLALPGSSRLRVPLKPAVFVDGRRH